MSRPNFSRSAAFIGLADVARELGVDIAAAAAEIGLPAEALTTPDVMVHNLLVGQLYGQVSKLSGAADIGLRVAERRRIDDLGVIGAALKHQPTLMAAMEVLRRYFSIQNEAVGVSYSIMGDVVEVQVFARRNLGTDIAHLTRFSAELVIGVLFRSLHELSEAPLSPIAVSFVHTRRAPLRSYQQVFGVEPLFDQESNSFTLARNDMIQLRHNVDPHTTERVNASTEAFFASRTNHDVLDRVYDLMMTRLKDGLPTISEVAKLLAMSPRTLNRRMAGENSTYQELVEQIRIRAAVSYLESSNLSLLEISNILGFAEQSGFSRWFRRTFGITPSEHRLQKRRAAG